MENLKENGCTVGVRDRGPGFDDEICGKEIVVADRCAYHAYWELMALADDLNNKEKQIEQINKRINVLKGGLLDYGQK
jgi:hypothetical protein